MKFVFVKDSGKRECFVWDDDRFSFLRKKRQVVLRFPGEVRVYRVVYADSETVVCDGLVDIKKLQEV